MKSCTLRLLFVLCVSMLLTACGGGNGSNTVQVVTQFPDSVFYSHTVAFRNSTTVAWGYGTNGQLGNGSGASQSTPGSVITDTDAPLTGMTEFSVGGTHTLAFNTSEVRAWGNNAVGQLGNNDTVALSKAVKVKTDATGNPDLTTVTAVAAGGDHSLALKADRTVWAWGYNGYGQLGINSNVAMSKVATKVPDTGLHPLPSNIQMIAAGGNFSLALGSDNRVWAWGYNQYGQLGNGTTGTGTPYPVQVPFSFTGGETVTAIAAGGGHSLAIDSKGKVWAWGYNVFGQLGKNPATDPYSSLPVEVEISGVTGASGARTIIKVAAGLDHSLALASDGTLWVWGYNDYGQLGDGVTPPNVAEGKKWSYTPLEIIKPTDMGDIIDIRAIGHHSIAITGDKSNPDLADAIRKGKVWAWGKNTYGQLGNGSSGGSNSTPARVTGY